MREREHLRLRARSVLASVGLLWVVGGCAIAAPAAIVLVRPGEAALTPWFFGPGLALAAAGGLLWRALRPPEGIVLSSTEAALVVTAAWGGVCVAGAVPLRGAAGLGGVQAIFESVSAWTTTGLSVVDVDRSPWIVLLYRSTLQLVGGAGFVVLALSAIIGPRGAGLPAAEGRQDQLVPNARRSARLVAVLYGSYAVGGFLALWAAGMSWFDALNHAFTAVSTGGFSTSSMSIGAWNSPAVELTCVVLMILGGTSFATAWLVVTGRMGAVMRSSELRLFAAVLPVAAVLVVAAIRASSPGALRALRTAVFETTSALTTTGFQTTTYTAWPALAVLVLIILMTIGGGSGSTAGGLKQHRVAVLALAVGEELRRRARPPGAVVVSRMWIRGQQRLLDGDEVRAAAVFATVYSGALAAGTIVLCAYGIPLRDALFEFASALGTVGLSVGVTSAAAPHGVLGAMTAAMFLGRLEFFVVLVAVARVAAHLRRAVRSRLAAARGAGSAGRGGTA